MGDRHQHTVKTSVPPVRTCYCLPVLSSSGLEGKGGMVREMAVVLMVMMLRMLACRCLPLPGTKAFDHGREAAARQLMRMLFSKRLRRRWRSTCAGREGSHIPSGCSSGE